MRNIAGGEFSFGESRFPIERPENFGHEVAMPLQADKTLIITSFHSVSKGSPVTDWSIQSEGLSDISMAKSMNSTTHCYGLSTMHFSATECDDVIEIPRGYNTATVTASEMSSTARPSFTVEDEERAKEYEEALRLLLDFRMKSERARNLTSVRFDTDIPKS
ncbi:hypothetical protein KIN20_035361 [Parelaphostrongylus tenuis]|uniref:Uncharacterized protein n=1 Tax=Parelaphostrongylus tenuis TaxID=148309 RepID=A0AAD5RBF5_PARTN|nr:hypothetical protein KIN20_035361 [Parelaphostrongylus tenuis]